MDNHLLLILMKLKLGASKRDLSLRFNRKEEYVSKIVKTWLPKLVNLIVWPERAALRASTLLKIVSVSLTVPKKILNALLI